MMITSLDSRGNMLVVSVLVNDRPISFDCVRLPNDRVFQDMLTRLIPQINRAAKDAAYIAAKEEPTDGTDAATKNRD
jgi:hypothetical protein